jgi:hypothetical protein
MRHHRLSLKTLTGIWKINRLKRVLRRRAIGFASSFVAIELRLRRPVVLGLHFAIGMKALSHGEREKARKHFEEVVALRRGWYNHHLAQGFLLRMEKDRDWPNWITPKDERSR